jgi:hypothetical protein
MTLRCVLDGFLLHAEIPHGSHGLLAYDGDEGFEMEALEALFYEVVSASGEELLRLEEAHYRLLRCAPDFTPIMPS